jgi:hypothetical protein
MCRGYASAADVAELAADPLQDRALPPHLRGCAGGGLPARSICSLRPLPSQDPSLGLAGVTDIAIVVPVLGRPERARALLQSIRSSSSAPHRVLFLCSAGDQARPAYAQAADKLTSLIVVEWEPGYADFAKKTNRGYAESDEPFIFCGATDLTFMPGWDVAALAVAEETGAGVIGTWDGANPAVMAGRHSTHPLVRRSYAEDPGCTVDASGAIYSEVYSHQLVDNELIETAQSRGVWAFAAESRVLHHHPLFDRRVPRDDTYTKALADSRQDRVLFMRRRRLWQAEMRMRERLARSRR